jgi:hypothetical protein
MMMRFLFLAVLLVFTTPAQAQEMSVAQAYQAIPHKQTTFDLKQSRIKGIDAKYLDHYFFAADVAVRARVMALRGFYGQKGAMSVAAYNREINNMIVSFYMVETPRHLKDAQTLLISAIRDQQAFFNEWDKVRNSPKGQKLKRNYSQHYKVQSSHKKLLKAYYMLMAQYPRESQRNKTAFFDHLCALDFI